MRGKDDTGKDLIISQAYITRGMLERAAELSTEWLGPRTEPDLQHTLVREVDQERWTSLDRTLQREAKDGLNHVAQPAGDPRLRQRRVLLVGRLQRLQRMGLSTEFKLAGSKVDRRARQRHLSAQCDGCQWAVCCLMTAWDSGGGRGSR